MSHSFGKKGGSSKGGSRDSKSKLPTGGSQDSTYPTRGSHDSKPYHSTTGIGTRSRPPPQSDLLFEEMRTAIQVLSHVLENMPTDMRLFSLALRSLYTDSTAVGKTAETKQFLQLRNSTTVDAKFYTKEILPKCSSLIAAIKEVFLAYSAVDFVEWKQDMADTIKEVDEHVLFCEQLGSLHGEIEESLRSRKQEADEMLRAMEKLPDSYTKQVTKMRGNAEKDLRWWAYSLSFIPAVRTEATALLSKSPNSVMTTALSKVAPGKLNNAACVVIRDTLMPALISFIQGVEEIKFFFNALGKDLELRKDDVVTQRLHYELMKKEAKKIMGYCQYFFAVIPGIETDLAAIPDATTDANFGFDWKSAVGEHRMGAAENKYVFRLDVVNGATKESHEVDVAEGQNLYQTLTAYQRKNKQFRMKCTGDDSDHIVHTIGFTSVDHKTSRRWSVYYGDANGQAVERASDVLEWIMPQPYEVIILQYQDVQKGRSRTKESKGEGSWFGGMFSSQ